LEQIQGELRVRIRLLYTSGKRGLLEMISSKVPWGQTPRHSPCYL